MNQLSYQAHPIRSAWLCAGLPSRSPPEQVPPRQPQGAAGVSQFRDHTIFSDVVQQFEKQHSVCTMLLFVDTEDRHFWGFQLSLEGYIQRQCCYCHSDHRAMLSCASVPFSPFIAIPCVSCAEQSLFCVTACAGIRSLCNVEETILCCY